MTLVIGVFRTGRERADGSGNSQRRASLGCVKVVSTYLRYLVSVREC